MTFVFVTEKAIDWYFCCNCVTLKSYELKPHQCTLLVYCYLRLYSNNLSTDTRWVLRIFSNIIKIKCLISHFILYWKRGFIFLWVLFQNYHSETTNPHFSIMPYFFMYSEIHSLNKINQNHINLYYLFIRICRINTVF